VAEKYISASEIGEYTYCGRAWWYRRHGARSANLTPLQEGTIAHDQLAGRVLWLRKVQRLAVWLMVAGGLLLALVLVLRALGG
jgi:CRISPR/Cas system-associated exonuclease Cas4 (RecB family)